MKEMRAQLTLFRPFAPVVSVLAAPERAPYVPGSDTSEEASARVTPRLGELQAQVLDSIINRPPTFEHGLTCDEVERLTGLDHQVASARIWELKDLCRRCGHRITYKKAKRRCVCLRPEAFLVDRGHRRKTRKGGAATVLEPAI